MTVLEATVEIVKATLSGGVSHQTLLTNEVARNQFIEGIKQIYATVQKLEEYNAPNSGSNS